MGREGEQQEEPRGVPVHHTLPALVLLEAKSQSALPPAPSRMPQFTQCTSWGCSQDGVLQQVWPLEHLSGHRPRWYGQGTWPEAGGPSEAGIATL